MGWKVKAEAVMVASERMWCWSGGGRDVSVGVPRGLLFNGALAVGGKGGGLEGRECVRLELQRAREVVSGGPVLSDVGGVVDIGAC